MGSEMCIRDRSWRGVCALRKPAMARSVATLCLHRCEHARRKPLPRRRVHTATWCEALPAKQPYLLGAGRRWLCSVASPSPRGARRRGLADWLGNHRAPALRAQAKPARFPHFLLRGLASQAPRLLQGASRMALIATKGSESSEAPPTVPLFAAQGPGHLTRKRALQDSAAEACQSKK